ncbi:hypothetical protein I551_5046 [Mycobacterium ulcerans str. Harvey]|uniref:Uncharacterized protein n=1 Tax=Mycobacterium ulcerans str. Harvey TaxID=1299332 RepID=A0ABN0QV08_MYCUL|nr:hypothetical protein I551_5046 [Mycobacterium ulcerans str. Harvey]
MADIGVEWGHSALLRRATAMRTWVQQIVRSWGGVKTEVGGARGDGGHRRTDDTVIGTAAR